MPGSKKVLIITYYWPPSGGAGVQRWLKFSKYLPDFGWQPYILTVDPDFAEFPAWDQSLSRDINPGVEVTKTRANNYFKVFSNKSGTTIPAKAKVRRSSFLNKAARFIRGNFFIPDPRKGWNKFAYRKAEQLITSQEIEKIITTGPPHSTHLIGRRLKRRFQDLKWITDFRDPWTDIYYYNDFYGTPPAKKIDRNYEVSVLREADIVITIGDGMKNLLESKIENSTGKVHSLPNGYDEADFINSKSVDNGNSFVITYVGSVSDKYPLEPFLSALSRLVSDKPDMNIILRFVGQVSKGMVQLIREFNLQDRTRIVDYSNHSDAIDYIISGDILLLLIPNHSHSEVIVTGKIFEYLRSGNAILGIGPVDGDAARIINKSSNGIFVDPGDIKRIEDFLLSEIRNKDSEFNNGDFEEFERRTLTSKLNDLLNK